MGAGRSGSLCRSEKDRSTEEGSGEEEGSTEEIEVTKWLNMQL